MTDTPERALLRRLVEDVSRHTDDLLRRAGSHGVPHDYMLGQTMAEARALLAQPAPECAGPFVDAHACPKCGPEIRATPRSRAEGSDLSVDQGREFRVVDGLGDSNRAGKVTIDPTLLSPPTPRSRAEAEAMVERFASALGLHVDHWLGPTETQRTEIADARAALLAALCGEDK